MELHAGALSRVTERPGCNTRTEGTGSMPKDKGKDEPKKDEPKKDEPKKDEPDAASKAAASKAAAPKKPAKVAKLKANLDGRVVAASRTMNRMRIEVLMKPGLARRVLETADAEDLIAKKEAVFIEFTDLPLS